MPEYKKVVSRAEVAPGTGKTVTVDGKELAVFNAGGTFYVMDNSCLHRGGPLGEGSLEGNLVTCPWHGWQFDVESGAHALNPQVRVRTYAVEVRGEDVLAAL